MTTSNSEDLGRKLGVFAVISDTHVNPDEEICNSPFPVNQRANRRFRHVVKDLNQREIDFVIHLGDLLHPVPEMGKPYTDAAQTYRDIVAELKCPIHILPGNHDIGDTPIKGGPASPTTPAMIEMWAGEFGADYTSFTQQGIRFILMNAQLINSGLEEEAKQKDWLERELESAKDERIMLFLHHPAYLYDPDELDHYDNTNQPGRGWLLNLLRQYDVEAMFSGHAHNFWYNRFEKTDFYLAPATSFVRQDYSEMLRAVPPEGSEAGRNDAAKLGYFIVNVYENGHVCKFVRTNGQECKLNEDWQQSSPSLLAPDPRENRADILGFDLRQNWAEISEVPPSGGLDEFDRKPIRNDYHLLALQEMGVKKVRLPLHDLLDDKRRARIAALKHLGFELTLFGYDIPKEKELDLVIEHAQYFSDWELTFDWPDIEDRLPAISKAHEQTGLPIYISRMRTKDDIKVKGTYFHVINHGFNANDLEQLTQLTSWKDHGIQGAVFRLASNMPVHESLAAIDASAVEAGLRASVHFRMAGDNPAHVVDDEWTAMQRICEAMVVGQTLQSTRIFCDTLVDVDRGYFVRKGAIDRCNNPRPLHSVIATLHTVFDELRGRFPDTKSIVEAFQRSGRDTALKLNWKSGGDDLTLKAANGQLVVIHSSKQGEQVFDLIGQKRTNLPQ